MLNPLHAQTSEALCMKEVRWHGSEDGHTFKIWAILLHTPGSTGKGGTYEQDTMYVVNSHITSCSACRRRHGGSLVSFSVSGGASGGGEGVRWGSGRGAPPLCPQRTGQLSQQPGGSGRGRGRGSPSDSGPHRGSSRGDYMGRGGGGGQEAVAMVVILNGSIHV